MWGRFVVVSSGENAAEDGENDEEDVEGVPAFLNDGGWPENLGGGGEERRHGEEEDGEGDDGQENDEQWRTHEG